MENRPAEDADSEAETSTLNTFSIVMSEEGKKRLNLLDAIKHHPGKKIIDKLHGFNATNAVLWGNQRDLIALIEILENPNDPLIVMRSDNRHLLEEKFTEVYRLLHNFLAAAATLVDHTRRLMDHKTINAAHKAEHVKDIKETFETDPLSRFVKDFRNYVLHRDRPEISLTVHLMPEPTRHELLIDLEAMLDWSKWSPPAKSFIECNSPTIRVSDFVLPYGKKVREFGSKFVDRFSVYYNEDLEAAFKLMREWNAGCMP